MERFVLSLLIMLMISIPLLADKHAEQRDIVEKKALFLRGHMDYIKQNAAVDNSWKPFAKAAQNYIDKFDSLTADLDVQKMKKSQLKLLLDMIDRVNQAIPMQLPDGSGSRADFGAYYTKLKYYPQWDKPWRVGPHADVVVRFGDDGPAFIFWRGTSYIPHWVADNGLWYNNQFTETWPFNCCEPMSDKQCRYSHVRILESHPGRVVVHWRYALNDVYYKIAWEDKKTGWGDWADEVYTLYPDAIGTRKITLHTSHTGDYAELETDDHGHEWAEGIVVLDAFVMPEEKLHYDAIHVANMAGKTGRWIWNKPGNPETHSPDGINIFMINSRSLYKPFVISPPGNNFDVYTGCGNGSRFNWWDHWPVSSDETSGRKASGRHAAHSSYFHIIDMPVYEYGPDRITKVHLHGMTRQNVKDLVPIAKSWHQAPKLSLAVSGFTSSGYDKTQRAYILTCKNESKAKPLVMELGASKKSPLYNPAFVIKNWSQGSVAVKRDGNGLSNGSDFTYGFNHTLEGTELVVWLRVESMKPVKISISTN